MSKVQLPEPIVLNVHTPAVIEGIYTADQLLAYGAACAAAERERCAKVCDALWDNSKYGPTAFGIDLCAEAIRDMEPT